jgi:hypothetical protein
MAVVEGRSGDDDGLHNESHDLGALAIDQPSRLVKKGITPPGADPALAALEASHMCGEQHRKIGRQLPQCARGPTDAQKPVVTSGRRCRCMGCFWRILRKCYNDCIMHQSRLSGELRCTAPSRRRSCCSSAVDVSC